MNNRSARRFCVIMAVAALGFASGVLAQASKPLAVFKETTHDFGKVKQGDVVSYEFVFKNEGAATLVVDKVETTCGCTAALVSEKKIAPGREGKLKTTFDTRGYSGRLTRYVYFVSNDGENPPSARIDVDKYNVDMGLILEGETPAAKILIKSTGPRELKVEMAHENVKFFSGGKPLASPFFLPSGEAREVELRFPPQTRTGIQRDYILLKSNDPIRSTLSVYVSRYVITKEELQGLFDKYRTVLKDRK
jgi:hypothetical protein